MSKRSLGGIGAIAKRGRPEDKYIDIVTGVFDHSLGGHKVVDLFTEIPSAELYPDYPEIVKDPISMAEISKRASMRTYETDDDFAADFELMLENARAYNGEESPVVDDAVAILDLVLEELGRPLSAPTRQRQQLKVLRELITYRYKGHRLSEAFMVEPDVKEYPEYYEVIKDPTSFNTVEARIQEVPCDDWDQFGQLVEPIFKNAMSYNAEGSQIHSDARTLYRQLERKIERHKPAPAQPARASSVAAAESYSDEEEEDEDDDASEEEVVPRVEHRFDDDEDDDFEVDADDFDDEDNEAGDVVHDEDMSDAQMDGMMGMDGMPGMPGMMPLPIQHSVVRDEIVYRQEGQTARDGMIQLVTVASHVPQQFLMPQHLQPGQKPQLVPPVAKEMVHVRIPASKARVMTAFSTTLAPHLHTLSLNVYLHDGLRQMPFMLNVVVNGRKLMPLGQMPTGRHDEFELNLSPGLNQVTVAVIRADSTGTVRPFGSSPIVGTDSDEERLDLWLNLLR